MDINKDLVAATSTPLVLAILAEGDTYGYAILKRVRELSGGELEWTDGMLYPVLHRLERSGLIKGQWEQTSRAGGGSTIGSRHAGREQLAEERRQWRTVDEALRKIWSALVAAARAIGSLAPALPRAETMAERKTARSGLARGADRAWRAHLRGRRAITAADAEELEDHLREQIASLGGGGLSDDEAFLVAVKRMGAIDALTREFAREHSERLWKQLVLSGGPDGAESPATCGSRRDVGRSRPGGGGRAWRSRSRSSSASAWGADGRRDVLPAQHRVLHSPVHRRLLRVGAAAPAHEPAVAGRGLRRGGHRRECLPVLPVARRRHRGPDASSTCRSRCGWQSAWPTWADGGGGATGGWTSSASPASCFIYYVLIALGGGVLIGLTLGLFQAIGIDVEPQVESWIVPCGVAGAVVIATWLVEAKQSVIENMAPVLTRIFAPLFALLLLAFIATMVWTGRGIDVEREILIAFDLLLVVVFGLLLYSISARDALAPPGAPRLDARAARWSGRALVVDALALWAIGSPHLGVRLHAQPGRGAGRERGAAGQSGRSAVLYVRFLRGRVSFARLERWQTAYLPVYSAWAAIVVCGLPPVIRIRLRRLMSGNAGTEFFVAAASGATANSPPLSCYVVKAICEPRRIPGGDMGTSERRCPPANTQELVAMWSATKEQHFIHELVQLLPALLGSGKLDGTRIEEIARHLTRALHLAARPEGGVHAAMDYLRKAVGGEALTD